MRSTGGRWQLVLAVVLLAAFCLSSAHAQDFTSFGTAVPGSLTVYTNITADPGTQPAFLITLTSLQQPGVAQGDVDLFCSNAYTAYVPQPAAADFRSERIGPNQDEIVITPEDAAYAVMLEQGMAPRFICSVLNAGPAAEPVQFRLSVQLVPNNFSALSSDGQRAAQQLYERCCSVSDSCAEWKRVSADQGVPLQTDLCELGQNICTPEGELTQLNMQGYGMSCEFPGDIFSQFSSLEHLYLSFNAFSGKLPVVAGQLAELPQLTELSLFDNQIEGPLDNDQVCTLFQAGALEMLTIGNNSITGTVPPCLFNANSSIFQLGAQNNRLEGTLPTNAFSNASRLQSLSLANNEIQGSIPADLAATPALQILDLSSNKLTGSLPQTWGSNIVSLVAPFNQISGGVPSNLTDHPTLVTLDLKGNQLTSLPEEWENPDPSAVTNAPPLNYLRVATNNIQGEFPASLANYPNLTYLILNQNELQGPLPEVQPGQYADLRFLNVWQNSLTGTIPSSWNVSGVFQNRPANLYEEAAWNLFNLESNNFSGPIPDFLSAQSLPWPVQVNLLNNSLLDLSACSNSAAFGYLSVCESSGAPDASGTGAPGSTESATAAAAASPPPSSTSSEDGGGGGLSGGAIAGIVIGTIAALALAAGLAVFLVKRRHVAQKSNIVGNSRFEKFDEEPPAPPPPDSNPYSNPYKPTAEPGAAAAAAAAAAAPRVTGYTANGRRAPPRSAKQQQSPRGDLEMPPTSSSGGGSLSSHWSAKTNWRP